MPGQIAQVIGTVVDVEFPADQLPNLFDALEVDNSGERLVLEVQPAASKSPTLATRSPFPSATKPWAVYST